MFVDPIIDLSPSFGVCIGFCLIKKPSAERRCHLKRTPHFFVLVGV